MSLATLQLHGTLKRAFDRSAGRPVSAPAASVLSYAQRAEKRVRAFLKALELRPGGADRINPAPGSSLIYPVEFKGEKLFISPPLSEGNSKLDPAVMIFDLPAIASCGNCKDCAARCYAMKAQKQYADVYNRRGLHLWLAVNQPDYLEALIRAQLKKSKKRFVRIHSSGDFFAQYYIDMWARIAAAFPRKRFYFYTKVDGPQSGFDFSALLSLRNVNRVQSVLEDGRINFGDWDYVQSLIAEGYRLCPYGVREYKARKRAEARADKRGLKGKARRDYIKAAEKKAARPIHCGDKCTLCMRAEKVCFLEH